MPYYVFFPPQWLVHELGGIFEILCEWIVRFVLLFSIAYTSLLLAVINNEYLW